MAISTFVVKPSRRSISNLLLETLRKLSNERHQDVGEGAQAWELTSGMAFLEMWLVEPAIQDQCKD